MANLHYLSDYSTFDSTQEMNYHVKQHTNKRYYDMNETQRQTLQIISQYAVNHNGSCHVKIETIMDALDKSRSTVIRSVNALVELCVIERLTTKRPISGGQGANIFRILPYIEPSEQSNDTAEVTQRKDDDKPRQERDAAPIVEKETAILLSYKSIINNTYVSNDEPSPYAVFKASIQTFLGNSIHKPSSDNKRLVSRLYGVYLAQIKQIRDVYKNGELIDIATKAIRITFATTKRKKLRNIAGYFNGILSNLLDDLCDEEISRVLAM